MREAIIQSLEKIASNSDTSFFGKCSIPTTDFRLSVQGVGPLKFPISTATAKKLIRCAKPAKFGWREQTLLDKTVRYAWEIPKQAIKIERRWQTALQSVLTRLQRNLGLPDAVALKAELHNLLIYEPGQFFHPHQDTEKSNGMVASLVVVLPSAHRDGQLVIDHQGSKKVFYTSRFSLDQLTCIAFYADCHHEVKKITEGYRIVLTYQLILEPSNESTTTFNKSTPTYRVLEENLRAYFSEKPVTKNDTSFQPPPDPNYFVYLMDHSYTQQGLSQDHLKGADRQRFSALKAAAETLGLDITLALADVQETWDCEVAFDDYYHPYYSSEDDDYGDSIEETELIVSETTLQHWIKPDGTPLDYAACWIPDEKIAWTKASNDFQPFESEYEGYMGNYGNTMDYWYHRAAIVLWRKQDYYLVRFTLDPKGTLKELNEFITSTQPHQLKDIIRHLLPYWPRYIGNQSHEASSTIHILQLALTLKDATLAKKLVCDLDLQALSPKTASILLELQSVYGTTWNIEILTAWTNAKRRWNSPSKCKTIADIIKHFSKNIDNDANELIDWLLSYQFKQLKIDHQTAIKDQSTTQRRHSAPARVKEIIDFIQACFYANQNKLAITLLDYVIAHPEQYPALELIPLLECLEKQVLPSKLAQWHYPECLKYVMNRLNEEYTKGVQATDDWSIEETWACTCEDCMTLKKFLTSRTAKTLRWPLAKERRKHIHRQIDAMDIAVTHETERAGSPHKLILTKTNQLHRQAKHRFQRVEKALMTVTTKTKKFIKGKHHESTTA